MKIRIAIPLIGGAAAVMLLLQGCATGVLLPTLRLWGSGHSYFQEGHQRLAATYRKDAAQLRGLPRRDGGADANLPDGRHAPGPGVVDGALSVSREEICRGRRSGRTDGAGS